MPPPDPKKLHDSALRQRAEALAQQTLSENPRGDKSLSSEQSTKVLHELRVYQIELEMQNETLRQAQIELETSRDRYVDLYEFAPVGYFTLTDQGMIEGVNLTASKLLGVEKTRLLHRSFRSLVISEDQGRWLQHFLQVKKPGGKGSVEVGLQRIDGTVFQVQMECENLKHGGDETSIRITMSDISERRRVELALQESETRFRTMANASPVLIWMSGTDKGCIWFNQQWLHFTGRTMEQEIGNGWAAGVHREDYEPCLDIYSQAFDLRQPFEIEYRLRRGDGEYRWVLDRGVPRYDEQEEFLGYIGSCIDVERLKHLEKSLNHAQRIGRIGSWGLEGAQRKAEWSDECRRILGAADGLVPSYEGFLAQVHPGDVKWVTESFEANLKGEPFVMEHRLLVSGEVKWVRDTVEVLLNADGEFRRVFGTIQDITELRRTDEDLQAANQRLIRLAAEQAQHLRELAEDLEQAEQRERERLYGQLHDQMQPSLVAARLLLSSLGSRSHKADCLQVAAAANAQISQVIDVARTLGLHLNPPQILVGGLKAALKSLIQWVKTNHRLEVALVVTAAAEPADKTIRMLFFNAVRELLMNVVKHAGQSRATVTLQVGEDGILCAEVADSGCGFDTTRPTTGTGLTMIRRRIEMFGGSLQVDSRIGQGTRVTLLLPQESGANAGAMHGTGEQSRSNRARDVQDTDRG